MSAYYDREELGKRLRKKRREHSITAGKLAEIIGKAPNYYRDIERGICGMSLDTLIQLAEYLEVSVDYLIFGEGIKEGRLSNPDAAYRMLMGYDEDIQKNAIKIMKTYLRISDGELKKEA